MSDDTPYPGFDGHNSSIISTIIVIKTVVKKPRKGTCVCVCVSKVCVTSSFSLISILVYRDKPKLVDFLVYTKMNTHTKIYQGCDCLESVSLEVIFGARHQEFIRQGKKCVPLRYLDESRTIHNPFAKLFVTPINHHLRNTTSGNIFSFECSEYFQLMDFQ